MASTINVLLTTFHGLDLPATLNFPLCDELPISTFADLLSERLPCDFRHLRLSTRRNQHVDPTSSQPISSLIDDDETDFLSLQLTSVLLGGKGGFGSQLRAAGGRMSSRKNRNNNRDPNASSRNLDGRRLRTVTEAKALAEYLATKPEMDKKERDERRRRWESIVESAERKEEDVKSGKKGVRLDGDWVEKKEEEETKTREAVLAMMKAGMLDDARTGSESDEAEEGSEEMEVEAGGSGSASGSSEDVEGAGTRSFFGWDDEDLSEDDEEDEDEVSQGDEVVAYEGKGKGRA
ncbi:hypothetical protein CAC42_4984 [Sphaceloma murrayae]|uniref:Uncharacterized protein n=1 Tax=Sphaceloma murrayae TaxID=2082308 RepID=A0A2K1QQ15_9PEZI|nr:hypothetical protein CAC42_4984 [Sphaceloma murrayae]